MAAIGTYVALGDSFTEGVGDPYPDGSLQGWADRFARELAAASPGLRYANLGIRGKLLGQVLAEQIRVAAGLAPDLVSLAAGGNDLMRRKADPDALAASFEQAVTALRAAGSQVLVFSGFEPSRIPLLRMVRDKAAAYNERLSEIARRHDCLHVDLWSMSVLADSRVWCADRLHLGPEGHRRVALRACEAAGLPVREDWREPLPATTAGQPGWLTARRADLRWARDYAGPWVQRRLRGVSSGDGLPPKRPDLLPL
jgi:lysophospholipase L1-like esterase